MTNWRAKLPLFALAAFLILAAPGCKNQPPADQPPPPVEPTLEEKEKAEPVTIAFQPAPGDEVWIKVDGRDVYKSEVEEEFTLAMARYGDKVSASEMKELELQSWRYAIQTMIIKAAIDNQIDKEGVIVTKGELEQIMADVQKKLQLQDKDYLDHELATLNLTEKKLQHRLWRQLRYEKHLKKQEAQEPNDEDLAKFYEENKKWYLQPAKAKVLHILIRLNAGSDPALAQQKRDLAETARKRIEGGEDFAAVAIELSDDPSRAKGGEMVIEKRGQFGADFDDAIFSLKPGELSPVLESPLGFHLVKMIQIAPEGIPSLAQVRPVVIEDYKKSHAKQIYQKYIADLIKQTKVEFTAKLPIEASVPDLGLPGSPDAEAGATAAPALVPGGTAAPAPGATVTPGATPAPGDKPASGDTAASGDTTAPGDTADPKATATRKATTSPKAEASPKKPSTKRPARRSRR